MSNYLVNILGYVLIGLILLQCLNYVLPNQWKNKLEEILFNETK